MFRVQPREQTTSPGLDPSAERFGGCQKMGGPAARTEFDSLKQRRQPAVRPRALRVAAISLGITKHNECGKVLVLGSQCVTDPGPHRRSPGDRLATLHHRMSFGMVVVLG